MALKLINPSIDYLPSYLSAVNEGFENMQLGFGDWSVDKIQNDGGAYIDYLNRADPFFFQELQVSSHEVLWFVNSDKKRFLGSAAIRFEADEKLINDFAGHGGISVCPSVLNKGYGVKLGQLLIKQLEDMKSKFVKTDSILLTCYKENKASLRLIEYFGGVLKKEVDKSMSGGDVSLIYALRIGS